MVHEIVKTFVNTVDNLGNSVQKYTASTTEILC